MAVQKTSEQRTLEETENFVQKSAAKLDEDFDLEEMTEEDDDEIDGTAAFDKMTLQDLESLPLDPSNPTALESGQIHAVMRTRKGWWLL